MAFLPKKDNGGDQRGFLSLQKDMNALFDRFFGGAGLPNVFGGGDFAPLVDVAETEEEVVVKAEIPGIEAKDLDITMLGDTLTIKGEKRSEKEEKDKNFHRIERSYGSFSRSVEVPSSVDPENVSADYKDGVLTIRLTKREEEKGKSIKVDVK